MPLAFVDVYWKGVGRVGANGVDGCDGLEGWDGLADWDPPPHARKLDSINPVISYHNPMSIHSFDGTWIFTLAGQQAKQAQPKALWQNCFGGFVSGKEFQSTTLDSKFKRLQLRSSTICGWILRER